MSILQTIDLKKYYGTEPNITRALDGVNFSVEDGEFVAVVGTSGSGKSTPVSYTHLDVYKRQVYHPKRNSVCRTAVSGAGKLSSQCGTL